MNGIGGAAEPPRPYLSRYPGVKRPKRCAAREPNVPDLSDIAKVSRDVARLYRLKISV